MPSRRLIAIPSSEKFICSTTQWSPAGHGVVFAGAAWWDDGAPPKGGFQAFVPYIRYCPSGHYLYKVVDEPGGTDLASLLRGLRNSVYTRERLPPHVAELRWGAICREGKVDPQLVIAWVEEKAGWSISADIEPRLGHETWGAQCLSWITFNMPLGLYLPVVQQELRRRMEVVPETSIFEVVTAAIYASRLYGEDRPRPEEEHVTSLATEDDRLLSKVTAIDQAINAVGRKHFWKCSKSDFGIDDYRALAFLSLEHGLPGTWPKEPARLEAHLGEIRKARRLLKEPLADAIRSFRPRWAHPWAVPFPSEAFVCTAHKHDLTWELARWTRSESFTQKRWVLGGGRFEAPSAEGAFPTTILWEGVDYLGSWPERPGTKIEGWVEELLMKRDETLSSLTLSIERGALELFDRRDASVEEWEKFKRVLGSFTTMRKEMDDATPSTDGPCLLVEQDWLK